MKIVEFLLNNLLPIFFAVLCLIAALKSIEIVKRSEVELMTKRRKEIERFESDTRKTRIRRKSRAKRKPGVRRRPRIEKKEDIVE